MGEQMYVLWVSGGPIEIQTPAWGFIKFSHTSLLSKEGFSAVLRQATSPPGPGRPETLKAEGHIFENCLQIKRYVKHVAN